MGAVAIDATAPLMDAASPLRIGSRTASFLQTGLVLELLQSDIRLLRSEAKCPLFVLNAGFEHFNLLESLFLLFAWAPGLRPGGLLRKSLTFAVARGLVSAILWATSLLFWTFRLCGLGGLHR